MAKSKITGKTFDEMLSESTELDLSAKFKDIIYEFSNDVHAMGIVVYTYEEGSAKFLFKDPAFTQPVTDYELLAMYLDEVVATRLVDSDMSLERCGYFETEKVNFLEYKEDNFVKKFYKIGNYFSGETYFDLNGFAPIDSKLALVDSAIVDTSVVGEEEAPAMQTIWEGSFSGLRNLTEDIQNASLLRNVEEVTVTFDGVVYTATVTKQTSEDVSAYTFGANDQSFSGYPFAFAWTDSRTPVITMIAQTDGEHTIKVEGTPVEPSSEILYENTFVSQSEPDSETGDYRYWYDTTVVQNMWKIADKENVKVTLDGTSYICDVNKYEEFDSWDLGDSAFINYPFHLTLTVVSDTETESSSYEMHIYIETGGEHTIKVEGTPSDNEDIPAGDPIEDIGVLPLQPGKDN